MLALQRTPKEIGIVIIVNLYNNNNYFKINFETCNLFQYNRRRHICPCSCTVTILLTVAAVVSDGRLINVMGSTPFGILYLLRIKPITLSM